MSVFRIKFERIDKETKETDWGQRYSEVLIDSFDIEEAEEGALAQLQDTPESHYYDFVWCGSAYVGD